MKKSDIITSHYIKQAEKHGLSSNSTMEDKLIRKKETEFILNFIAVILQNAPNKKQKILDIGCGNGYTLKVLSQSFSDAELFGLDSTKEMINLVKKRNIINCISVQGDAKKLPYKNNLFDVVYTQRCLINILNWKDQILALNEIYRILKPKGYYLMIEAFNDGLENKNKARIQCGLQRVRPAYHNKYINKTPVFKILKNKFVLINARQFSKKNRGYVFKNNFLSTHYFISRVVYPLLSKKQVIRNSEFVKFFSFLPDIGNYAPIQAYFFRKK